MSADFITVLVSRGLPLTKRWLADGSIEAHSRAKWHTVETFPVSSIHDVARVMDGLLVRPDACMIRGAFIGNEESSKILDPERPGPLFVRRSMDFFRDRASHVQTFDIDKWTPKHSNPDTDPEGAAREWIAATLPPEFLEISFVWALSSSAGHPTKAGTFNAHLSFYISRAMTSAESHAWATMNGINVDRAFFQPVQAHFTAAPIFDPGVVDPIKTRAGFYEGLFGDVVELQLDEGALAVALREGRKSGHTGSGDGGTCLDPRQKPGIIGAFCRAFEPEDVLMADWFKGNFEQVNDRRWTWLDGGGALEGAYITDDRHRFINSHNTSPCDTIGQGLNSWDLTRIYNFGHLDDAVPEDQRTFWLEMPSAKPSEGAMKSFALSLPEVQAELEAARAVDNPFSIEQAERAQEAAERTVATAVEFDADLLDILGPPPVLPLVTQATEVDFIDMPHPVTLDSEWGLVMGEKIKHRLFAVGLTDEERAELIDSKALSSAWLGCFYNPGNSKMYMMNKAGQVVQFGSTRWQKMVQIAFGKFLKADILAAVTLRLSAERGTDRADVEKELRKVVWDTFAENVEMYRQRSEVSYRVDMFATAPGVVLTQDRAEITYIHEDFKVRPTGVSAAVEEAILAEYREHFDLFDEFVDLLLYSRFAADRRQAFLHMQCLAGFGKGFLLQGVLGADGLQLATEMSVTDIERCFEGSPSGLQPTDFVRAWVIAVDEFKSAKGEVKQLNNRISLAPKGQLRAIVEVYLKLFLSAEGVDSLAGSEGVEAQFADRFSMYEMPEGTPRLDDRPLFRLHGKLIYRTVIANHVARVLNAGVAKMRLLGQAGASKAADAGIAAFHTAHAIGNTHGLLSDTLPGIADDVAALINEWALHTERKGTTRRVEMLSAPLKMKLETGVSVVLGRRLSGDVPTKLVVAKGLSGIIKDYLGMTADKSQLVKVSHKASAIASLVMGRKFDSPARYYVSDEAKLTKGAILDLKMTPEMMSAAAEFGGADVLVFPELGAA